MQYRRARRKFDDEPENHERWLISYADFITLLFAFFVVMYAISAVNIGKYKIFSDALGDAFGGKGAAQPVNTEVPNLPVPNPALKRRVELLRKEKSR
jgi:chemotaxis protein MotB